MKMLLGWLPSFLHTRRHDAIAGDVAGQIDFHHIVKLHALFLHRLVQLFGLGDIAGETIKQPAVSPFGLQGFEDHGNGDGVRDEFSAIHIFLGLFAEFGSAAHVFAENGSGFDMGQTKRLLDESACVPLPLPLGPNIRIFMIQSLLCKRSYGAGVFRTI